MARINQTIEKVLDKDALLPERILTLIREQIVVIISTLTAIVTGITPIVLSAIGDFGGGGGGGGPPAKDKGALKKWLDRLADALKKLAVKAVEALRAIMGSVVVAILGFLGKAVGFVVEHTFNCFYCRTYWCIVDAKGIDEASGKKAIVFFANPQVYPLRVHHSFDTSGLQWALMMFLYHIPVPYTHPCNETTLSHAD